MKLLDKMHKYKTIISYCLKCRKNTKIIIPKTSETSAVCGSKKLKFIKKQEAKKLLSSLGVKTPSSKISLVGPVLF